MSTYALVDISPLVTAATERGIPTIGIDDHGNELGFGTIYDVVVKTMPKGDKLATTIATDVVLPVMMSNWGCYGVEACLAFLIGQSELIHSPQDEARILRACLDAGGLEAMHCTTDFLVVNGGALSGLADARHIAASGRSAAGSPTASASFLQADRNLDAVGEKTRGFLDRLAELVLLPDKTLVAYDSAHALLCPDILDARLRP